MPTRPRRVAENGCGGNGRADIPGLLRALAEAGVAFKDLSTHQSSLEDIFVTLVHGEQATPPGVRA